MFKLDLGDLQVIFTAIFVLYLLGHLANTIQQSTMMKKKKKQQAKKTHKGMSEKKKQKNLEALRSAMLGHRGGRHG